MSTVIRFNPDLSGWISQNLDLGNPPHALSSFMQQQNMEAIAADAIVAAFVRARKNGQPVPVNQVIIDADSIDYQYPEPRLQRGHRITAGDREVLVLARCAEPCLASLANVMSAEECEQLIELARPRLKPSTIVDPVNGKDVVRDWRSSNGMFFRLQETPLIARLDQRMADIMNMPVENGEGIQVLHYPQGCGSEMHYDFLLPSSPAAQASIARSGQRVSTLVCYLNDVAAGGETSFPQAHQNITPIRGHAAYFEYANQHGQLDHASLHGSLPVLSGEKWVATKWVRSQRFVSA